MHARHRTLSSIRHRRLSNTFDLETMPSFPTYPALLGALPKQVTIISYGNNRSHKPVLDEWLVSLQATPLTVPMSKWLNDPQDRTCNRGERADNSHTCKMVIGQPGFVEASQHVIMSIFNGNFFELLECSQGDHRSDVFRAS